MLKAKVDLVGPTHTAQGSSWLYSGTFQKEYKEKSSWAYEYQTVR